MSINDNKEANTITNISEADINPPMVTSNDKKQRIIAFIYLILTVLFWGYSFISTKIVLNEIPPASIAFFRQVIALVVLLVWLLPAKKLPRISLKEFFRIAFAAIFGIVLYFLFENTGLKYTGASNASMIVSAVPIFTLLTEVLFFKLKASVKILICILFSIFGVYLVISVNGKLDFSSKSFYGNMLVMGAMVSWVIYTILNKSFSERHSSTTLTAYQTLSSIFLFLPFVISEAPSWKPMGIVPIINLLYLGIFCSAFAYFFFIYASKRLGPTISSSFLNLIPVVTVLSGYFVLGEKIAPIQIVGMLIILASLYYLSMRSNSKKNK